MPYEETGKLVSLIGDEDTCVGFLLGGIGEIDQNHVSNFLVVKEDTEIGTIEATFKRFVKSPEVRIVLIARNIADLIRKVIDTHTKLIPVIIEIPTKEQPYEIGKDKTLSQARMFYSEE